MLPYIIFYSLALGRMVILLSEEDQEIPKPRRHSRRKFTVRL